MMAKYSWQKKMPSAVGSGIVGFHFSVVRHGALPGKTNRKWESLHWPHQEEGWGNQNLLTEEIFQTMLYPWRTRRFFFESCPFVNMRYLEFSYIWTSFETLLWLLHLSEKLWWGLMRAFYYFFLLILRLPSSQSQLDKCGWIVSSQSQWSWWVMTGSS